MAHRFVLMPVSQGNNMPVFCFQKPAENSIDGIKGIVSDTNCKSIGLPGEEVVGLQLFHLLWVGVVQVLLVLV